MKTAKREQTGRWRRRKRVRKQLFGTSERPRLTVFRSHKHMYAQLVDDLSGKTLCSACTLNREIKDQVKHGGDVKASEVVGTVLGQRAIMHGVKKVVFDRGPYKFHGRVKAVAEAARKAGLEF